MLHTPSLMSHMCILGASPLPHTQDAREAPVSTSTRRYSSKRDARVDTIRMYDDAVTLVYMCGFM